MSTSSHPPIKLEPNRPAGTAVVPGDRIGRLALLSSAASAEAPPGTYVRGPYVRSSLSGRILPGAGPSVTAGVLPSRPPPVLPAPGDAVLGRVARVSHSAAASVSVRILALLTPGDADGEEAYGGAVPLADGPHVGIVRRDDIDAFRSEGGGSNAAAPAASGGTVASFSTHERYYRPGDVIVARVLSVGDGGGENRYILTTAEDSLGVVEARCAHTGLKMTAEAGGDHFVCKASGRRERRKVAVTVRKKE